MEITHGGSSLDQVGRELPALGRVLDGFKRRWQSKRDANGNPLGDMWPGALEHRGRADAIAVEFENAPAELEASLDGYFASTDPFAVKVRWNFKTWANDPRRWISARTEPEVDPRVIAELRRTSAAVLANDDDEMVLPPRKRA